MRRPWEAENQTVDRGSPEQRAAAVAYWEKLKAEWREKGITSSPATGDSRPSRDAMARANERLAVRTPSSGIVMTDDLRRTLSAIAAETKESVA